MTQPEPALCWFRDDLRLADNPALAAACASGRPVICVYVLDEASSGLRRLGGAACWWRWQAPSRGMMARWCCGAARRRT
jgi:deoxyribodipyrimidine photo-lyase